MIRSTILGLLLLLAGCAGAGAPTPPLSEIYSRTAQEIGSERNPVVVIPGILGSRLVDEGSGQVVWGAFVYGAADPDYPEGARTVALPMREGVPLRDLRDEIMPDGVLESLDANVGVLKVRALEPYRGIIEALAAGRFVDRDIDGAQRARAARGPGAGPIDYAGLHYTCFQFDYDWRRDVSENAARLDSLIREASAIAAAARGMPAGSPPPRVDVVAHSMGGMVLQYYLRYGTQPLLDDGSLPRETWAGAELVEKAIIVGTPNAGSVLAVKQLVEGTNYAPITPTYQPAVLGTMPSIYQLMPRARHARVVDAETGAGVDLYDARTWERLNWGLADPDQDRYLRWLLPEVSDPAARRRIAIEHLAKCLARARQVHAALDAPASPPPTLAMELYLGDAVDTPDVFEVDARTGEMSLRSSAPGDGTVTRASALADERLDGHWTPRLRSPLSWERVQFVAADHIGLTAEPEFVDSLLFTLLERPR